PCPCGVDPDWTPRLLGLGGFRLDLFDLGVLEDLVDRLELAEADVQGLQRAFAGHLLLELLRADPTLHGDAGDVAVELALGDVDALVVGDLLEDEEQLQLADRLVAGALLEQLDVGPDLVLRDAPLQQVDRTTLDDA